jgi:hypothetical protein
MALGYHKVDRPHRFEIGDQVTHVDSTPGISEPATVTELTWRIRDGIAYPTYTLFDPSMDGDFTDILDTVDLILAKEES